MREEGGRWGAKGGGGGVAGAPFNSGEGSGSGVPPPLYAAFFSERPPTQGRIPARSLPSLSAHEPPFPLSFAGMPIPHAQKKRAPTLPRNLL